MARGSSVADDPQQNREEIRATVLLARQTLVEVVRPHGIVVLVSRKVALAVIHEDRWRRRVAFFALVTLVGSARRIPDADPLPGEGIDVGADESHCCARNSVAYREGAVSGACVAWSPRSGARVLHPITR